MFQNVRTAFQREWLEPNGRITNDTHTGYLLALAFDLLTEDRRAAAAGHLVEDIKALDWHLSTGFIGISHLNPQLTLAGRADVAYRLRSIHNGTLIFDHSKPWITHVSMQNGIAVEAPGSAETLSRRLPQAGGL